MLIRTKSKKELVNVIRFSISKAYSIDRKFFILGQYGAATFFNENNINLGRFDTLDEAISELDNIHKFFEESPNGIYEMK